ncbi:hypothetical protein ACH5RR_001225 [Cinchona calisaya]|uniref:Uncharacterized protein n=1 Tax=Cinchona calisaya TaxID=153742 RepID=A0ABD3B407_9GENT
MARIGCFPQPHHVLLPTQRIHSIQCCSGASNGKKKDTRTPKFLKLVVSGVTELVRLFSSSDKDRLDTVNRGIDEILVWGIDDVLMIIKSDYEKAYFVTGLFTSAIYAADCAFEDPTIKFQGRDLYLRNLKLLIPFFDSPSILLEKIEKGINSKSEYIRASWKLRTYVKLPWRPLISIDGSTVYDLDEQLRVIRHVESWNISALEAIGF